MTRKTIYRKVLIMVFIAVLIYTCWFSYSSIYNSIPDVVNVAASSESVVELEQINSSVKIVSGDVGEYSVDVSLLGIFPLKQVNVNVVEEKYIIPGGMPIGLYLQTDGVIIVGTSSIKKSDGSTICPAESIVQEGDYITAINAIPVSSKSQLAYLVNKYGSSDVVLTIKRDDEVFDVSIQPVYADDETYKLGIWIRDDAQGIGTLTYLTSDGEFGALGHGISDTDTGGLLESNNGLLYEAQILGVKKSQSGEPGGLIGTINYENENIIGIISNNTTQGIFGNISTNFNTDQVVSQAMPIAYKQEVHKGKAYILSGVEGMVKQYEVEIVDVNIASDSMEKGMVVEITDEELLNITNGIIQGMSGSPIIQDGKVIGAVTHVFVQNTKRGYGIFIENMLASQDS